MQRFDSSLEKSIFNNFKPICRILMSLSVFFVLFFVFCPEKTYAAVTFTKTSMDPTSLNENNLDNAVIVLTLNGSGGDKNVVFVTPLLPTYFTLNNGPSSTFIRSIERTSNTVVTITIGYDGKDFDSNVSNFNITALATSNTRSVAATCGNLPITAIVENNTNLSLSAAPTTLYSNCLASQPILLTLAGCHFKNDANMLCFSLNNEPSGVSISNVTINTSRTATVFLTADSVSVTSDITNFSITLNGGVVGAGNRGIYEGDPNSTSSITSNNMTIKALDTVEGYTSYTNKGTSYPTNVTIAGYDCITNILYINFDASTLVSVPSDKSANFNYFIDVFDDATSEKVVSIGTYNTPLTSTGPQGSQDISVVNCELPLMTSLPISYRIMVIIKSILLV